MTKPNSTEIIFVVDRSGSMKKIASDMCGGFDEFIKKQKETPGECRVSLVQFDDVYETVYSCLPLESVPPLVLEPRGMTALLDAVGRTINDTGTRLRAMREPERPTQVLFVIVTDGEENSSREFNQRRVFDMITHQREKYSWEFVFLGANQDSITVAKDIGINITNAVTYDASTLGAKGLMRGLSFSVSNYRTVGSSTMDNLYDQQAYNSAVNDLASDAQLVGPDGNPLKS